MASHVVASVNRSRIPAKSQPSRHSGLRPKADRERYRQDQRRREEVGQGGRRHLPAQDRRRRDRHRPEAVDDAALHVHVEAYRGVRDAADDRHDDDPRHDEVDVAHRAGLLPERPAPHVDEQEHEGDRHEQHRDDRVRAAGDVAQAAPGQRPGVCERAHQSSSRPAPVILRNTSSSVATFWENSVGSIRASSSATKMPATWATVPSVVIVSVAPSPSAWA